MAGTVIRPLVARKPLKPDQPIACSRCGVVCGHHSPANGIRQLFSRFLTDGSPYRCESCAHRAMALRAAQSAINTRVRL